VEGNGARYGRRYLDGLHAEALAEDARRFPPLPPEPFSPPGPPVPRSAPEVPQKDRTNRLYNDLAEVVNTHRASPETVLMALDLLRAQALAPRLRQVELEG